MPLSPSRQERDISLGPLTQIVGYHVAQAAVTTYAAFDRHIGKPFALRRVEFSLLMLLHANGALSPKQLAATLTLTAPTLTLLLDRLQTRGLIRRERNPADGRSQHILLTASGQDLARESAQAALPMERELELPLSPAEHAMLIELLGRLAGRKPSR
jgi:DNA-binding MarR family transcriptional regulator